MTAQAVRFQAAGDSPPALEGELWTPDDIAMVPGVVVAHPHPLRGGSMHSNVVVAVCEGLQAAGIAWLRFNFRGVARSEGAYDDGVGERLDVQGALSFLGEQPGIDSGRLGLAGYSFGARVSLEVAAASRVKALLCVAPPVREPVAGTIGCPLLVLVGDRDGNLADGVDAYASRLPNREALQVVRGTDHFWRGFESVLVDAAREFFAQALAKSDARVSR